MHRNDRPPQHAEESLRFLIDLKHPAHFHFFRNVIPALKTMGHDVAITTRRSGTTEALLKHFGHEYHVISRPGRGYFGLMRELIARDFSLFRFARQFRPHAMAAKHGVCISHVGRLLGIPTAGFEDTDHAKLQTWLSWPHLTHVYTEQSYTRHVGSNEKRYNSLNALAYLHPNHFTPNPTVLDRLGIGHGEPYILVRFVGWDAAHDLGHRWNRDDERRHLVAELAKLARVLIVPERTLPDDLTQYVPSIEVHEFHDLMALAAVHVGEGGAAAGEAAVLGVPTIYANPLELGYIHELSRYGLLHWETDAKKILPIVQQWMQDPVATRYMHKHKRAAMLAKKIDPVPYILDELLNLAQRKQAKSSRQTLRRAA